MKKVHRAVRTGPNKWEKRTGWKLDAEDIASLAILLIVAGFVVIRSLIGQPERFAGSTPAPAVDRAASKGTRGNQDETRGRSKAMAGARDYLKAGGGKVKADGLTKPVGFDTRTC